MTLKNRKIVCDITTNELKSFYVDIIFKLMGIEAERIIVVNKTTKISRILIPDLSYIPGQYMLPLYIETLQYALRTIEPKNYEKIYLSRRHFAKKNRIAEIGEKKIENIFRDNGFEVIFPEELTLIEQLEYYKNCRILASPNGSLAHNILWCNVGTHQVIINRFYNDKSNPHQSAINVLLGNRVTMVNSAIKGSKHQHCCYYIGAELKEFCIKNGMCYNINLVVEARDICEFFAIVFAKYGSSRVMVGKKYPQPQCLC